MRANIDSEDHAWRIMTVYWLEAMARLYGLEDVLLTGFSTRLFNDILKGIAVESGGDVPENGDDRADSRGE